MFVMKFRLVPPDPQPDPKGVPTLLAEDHHLSGLVDLEDWVRLELASGASRALAALERALRLRLATPGSWQAQPGLLMSEDPPLRVWLLARPGGYLLLAAPEAYDALAGLLADLAQSEGALVHDRGGSLFHMALIGATGAEMAAKGLDLPAPLKGAPLPEGVIALRLGDAERFELHLLGPYDLQADLLARLNGAA